jgi:oligoribonuclease (3'-5' exoribonuclease)
MSEAQQKSVIELPATSFTRNEDRGMPAVVQQTPMAMVAMAVSRGMDVSTIKDLLDLQQRWEKGEAEKAYNEAFAAFKAEAVQVIKNKTVTDGPLKGKSYAELFAVVDAATPYLSKYGLSASWKITKDEKDWIEVTCILKHVKGHAETCALGGPPDAGGAKNAIQARASTVSYLERYTFKGVTGLAEKNQDDDGGRGSKGMPDSELQEWVKKIEATTTKEKAKEVCAEGVKAANKYNDLSAYNALKGVHKSHTDFIEKAAK